MSPIRSLAFVINAQKSGAAEIAEDLMAIARANDVAVNVVEGFLFPPMRSTVGTHVA